MENASGRIACEKRNRGWLCGLQELEDYFLTKGRNRHARFKSGRRLQLQHVASLVSAPIAAPQSPADTRLIRAVEGRKSIQSFLRGGVDASSHRGGIRPRARLGKRNRVLHLLPASSLDVIEPIGGGGCSGELAAIARHRIARLPR